METKGLKWLVFLAVLVFVSGCATVGFPPPRPGMVIVGNATKANREIRVFPESHSVRSLKTVDNSGNQILSVSPLRLLWAGERNNNLVFKSEELVSPETKGSWVSKFTIPCSYIKFKGGKMASQTAVLYLKPNSRYTLYVRDLRVTGELLGERTIRVRTSYDATRDKRRTHLGTIWADKIIDLPRVRTQGPSRLGVEVIIDPFGVR